jgi:hypothetical protein
VSQNRDLGAEFGYFGRHFVRFINNIGQEYNKREKRKQESIEFRLKSGFIGPLWSRMVDF